jgi:hypothetical protein
MPRTPDRFPGERQEEGIQFDTTDAAAPAVEGELKYVQGIGFQYLEDGIVRNLTGSFSPSQHFNLDTLVHDAEVRTSYDSVTYTGNKITNYTVWTDNTTTDKIREYQVSYIGNKISQIVTKQYNAAQSIVEQITEVISYTGNKVTSISRTKDI